MRTILGYFFLEYWFVVFYHFCKKKGRIRLIVCLYIRPNVNRNELRYTDSTVWCDCQITEALLTVKCKRINTYTIPYNFHDAETVWNPIVFPLSRRVCAHEVGYALLCIFPHGKSLLSPPYETHCNEPLPFYGILLAHLIIPFTMEYECH